MEFFLVDQCVMATSGDISIKIWAVSDGSCLKTFEGHTSSVLRASFLSRGTQFVSCGKSANLFLILNVAFIGFLSTTSLTWTFLLSGGDGLVKLWTIKSNECIATYDQHEGKVVSCF